jgi:hypothetical protein
MPGLGPDIHVLAARAETWMAGSNPAMTKREASSGDQRRGWARLVAYLAEASLLFDRAADAACRGFGPRW